MTFHVRFGLDDSGTESDWRAFASMISALGYPSPVEVVIENNESLPDLVVGGLVDNIIRKCNASAGRSLVIGHYSGHGMSIDDTLFFSNATGSQKFSYPNSLGRIADRNHDGLTQTDALLLIDSCYSGLATRDGQRASRIVEVCSAVDASEFTLGSSPQRPTNTFTSRLVTEVMKCLRQGNMIVEFTSVIARLRQDGSRTRKVRYRLVCGTHGLKVPSFKTRPTATTQVGTASRRQRQTSSSPAAALASDNPITDLRAMFVVHLGDNSVDDDEVKHVVSWIDKLPASVGMEIQSVFRSESTTMVLSAPWALWSVLDGLRGFTLAAEVQSHNLLDHIRGATQGFQPLPLQQVQNLPRGSKAESSKIVHRADY
ncbi:MAG: hypothetical protein M1815_004607 [Lichina confinis]|nr:MAG: hypothetical protein M1815_004607 [Lichina confinis]